MSTYVTVNSQMNLEFFPDNDSCRFRTRFQQPLFTQGLWVVALMDFKSKCSIKLYNQVYLYSDVCDDSIVDGVMKPLLRRFILPSTGNDTIDLEFSILQYVPVRKSEIYDMEFYLTDEKGNPISFLSEPVSITLHFKSYPFFK